MKKFLALLGLVALGLLLAMWLRPDPAQGLDAENLLLMDLKYGRVVIALRPDRAPAAVAQVKRLARAGFYDGLSFHRVIPGFMAQGGDPNGDGTGGSGNPVPDEFNDIAFARGTVGMARAEAPDTGDSQFFIMFRRNFSLDGNYTAIGRVVGGMEYVDKLKKGDEAVDMGLVKDPDRIIHMRVAADVWGHEHVD